MSKKAVTVGVILVIAAIVAVALVSSRKDVTLRPGSPSNVTGKITEVEPTEGTPTSFVVENDDGETYTIEIDPDVDYGFDLAHLHEHHEAGDPVDVDVRDEDGTLYAESIEDI